MRLGKLVAQLTGTTRTQGRELIKSGRICVNGKTVRDDAVSVNEMTDSITLDQHELRYQRFYTIMMNKPAGVISATEDPHTKTVLDLLKKEDRLHKGLSPVGRLDKDTEGLLLLSNDGALAHDLISPKKHADKLYFAKLLRKITKEDIMLFESGMKVDEELTAMPARLRFLTKEEQKDFCPEGEAAAVTLQEGKFHQVKRMFAATGNEVLYLKRMAMGGLTLDKRLQPGEYRELSEQELFLVRKNTEKKG